ncbi:hypothetical protein GQ600_10910 [Phytophthora cactorum]|nr:hypothetical protein GQ600_10910 [Phytophthora cactorum]
MISPKKKAKAESVSAATGQVGEPRGGQHRQRARPGLHGC